MLWKRSLIIIVVATCAAFAYCQSRDDIAVRRVDLETRQLAPILGIRYWAFKSDTSERGVRFFLEVKKGDVATRYCGSNNFSRGVGRASVNVVAGFDYGKENSFLTAKDLTLFLAVGGAPMDPERKTIPNPFLGCNAWRTESEEVTTDRRIVLLRAFRGDAVDPHAEPTVSLSLIIEDSK